MNTDYIFFTDIHENCADSSWLGDNEKIALKCSSYLYYNGISIKVIEKMHYTFILYEKNFNKLQNDLLNKFEYYGLNQCLQLAKELQYDYDFSLLIVDHKQNKMFAFRSPNGVVPQYFYFKNNSLIISSNVHWIAKSIKKSKLSELAIAQLFAMDYLLEPTTFYEDIFEIERQYVYQFDLKEGKKSQTRYYNFQYSIKKNASLEYHLSQLKNEITSAHAKRLGCKNGIFLSGGLDSVVICYAMKQLGQSTVESFNISVKGQQNSEAPYAQRAAEHFEIKHNSIIFDVNEIDYTSMRKKIFNSNFPYWGMLYTGSIFEKLGINGYTMFTGQDTRLHTPYLNYIDSLVYYLNRNKNSALAYLLAKVSEKCIDITKGKIHRLFKRLKHSDDIYKYTLKTMLHCDPENTTVANMINPQLQEINDHIFTSHQDYFNHVTWLRWGQQYVDDIKYMDSMTNYYNNICQFPFYDMKLAEVSASIPFKYSNKIYLGKAGFGEKLSFNKKYMLTKLLEKENISANIINRNKATSTTIHLFFNGNFGNLVRESLLHSRLVDCKIINDLNLKKILDLFCQETRTYHLIDCDYLIKVYNLYVLDVLLNETESSI